MNRYRQGRTTILQRQPCLLSTSRNRNLHIVREPGESKVLWAGGDKAAKQAVEEMQDQAERDRKKFRRRVLIIVGAVALLAAAVFLVIHLQTYGSVRVEETYKIDGVTDSSYREFADGVLKYSRDGVSYLNIRGEEQWNQSVQFKNPFVEINGTTAVSYTHLDVYKRQTLEEPPEYVIFILATTEANKIPVTILSRCQRYDLKRISIETIADRLRELIAKEQWDVEDKAVRYLARAADGSMRDALSLLDQCAAFYMGEKLTYDHVLEVLGAVDTEVFSRLLRELLAMDAKKVIETVDELVMQGRRCV